MNTTKLNYDFVFVSINQLELYKSNHTHIFIDQRYQCNCHILMTLQLFAFLFFVVMLALVCLQSTQAEVLQ